MTVVSDGQEALDALARETFDLVLMDVQMPVMGGFEATAAIRAHEQKTGGHTRIVAMTAHAMTGDRERCFAAGMDGYLSKPIDPQLLYAIAEGGDVGIRDQGSGIGSGIRIRDQRQGSRFFRGQTPAPNFVALSGHKTVVDGIGPGFGPVFVDHRYGT